MRMLRALFMRIINWIRNVASTASRGLCNGEARRFAKPLDLLGRNAKTRWGEPAGLERYGHVAVTKFMEAAGIEPASRDASDPASTCLANCSLSRPPRSLLASVRCASLELF